MLITILILEVIHITFWGTILVLCEIVILWCFDILFDEWRNLNHYYKDWTEPEIIVVAFCDCQNITVMIWEGVRGCAGGRGERKREVERERECLCLCVWESMWECVNMSEENKFSESLAPNWFELIHQRSAVAKNRVFFFCGVSRKILKTWH